MKYLMMMFAAIAGFFGNLWGGMIQCLRSSLQKWRKSGSGKVIRLSILCRRLFLERRLIPARTSSKSFFLALATAR